MAIKTNEFSNAFHQYIFSNTKLDNSLFEYRPNRWGISIHDKSNNPTKVKELTSSWYNDDRYRKSSAEVINWQPKKLDSYEEGVGNAETISFSYVPAGETWEIRYFIVWALYANPNDRNDIINYYPIYAGSFKEPIVLTENQVLQFAPGHFVVNK